MAFGVNGPEGNLEFLDALADFSNDRDDCAVIVSRVSDALEACEDRILQFPAKKDIHRLLYLQWSRLEAIAEPFLDKRRWFVLRWYVRDSELSDQVCA